MIGYGRLQVSQNWATDGVVWFRIWSPRLKRARRVASEAGWFLAVFGWIVWFKRDRRMQAHHISLGERYYIKNGYIITQGVDMDYPVKFKIQGEYRA